MTTEIDDLFAIARRLADVRVQPPPPLRIHLADRPRDGPDRHPESLRGPKRVTGPSGDSVRTLRFSYRSKGLES